MLSATLVTRLEDLTARSLHGSHRQFFAPCMDLLPPAHAALLALLPIHDVNGILLQRLAAGSRWPSQAHACVLAIDPFRTFAQLFRTLRQHGVMRVCNYPSVASFDEQTREMLGSLSMGLEREIEFVKAASAAGLQVAAIAESNWVAREMLDAGACALVAPRSLLDAEAGQLSVLAAGRGAELILGPPSLSVPALRDRQQDVVNATMDGAIAHAGAEDSAIRFPK